MGIRKHLEEHPGETKLSDLTMNIQEKEDNTYTSADFEFGELLSGNWENLKEKLEEYRAKNEISAFAELAYYFKIIYPEKIPSLNLDTAIKSKIEKTIRQVVGSESIQLAVYYRTLFPGTESPRVEVFREDLRNKTKRKLVEPQGVDLRTLREIYEFKSLFPNDSEQVKLSQQVWDVVESDLKFYHKEESWYYFTQIAAFAKLLFPEKSEELKTIIPWKKIQSELSKSQELGHWNDFAKTAFNLAILSADEVEITDQGLKLTMPKSDFEQQKIKRPERRQF